MTSKGPTQGQGLLGGRYRDRVLEPAATEQFPNHIAGPLFEGREVFVSVWVTGGLQHPKACLGT